jgi:hypothetical protein
MLGSSFNLWQSLRTLSLLQKTVQIRDQLFLYTDPGKVPKLYMSFRLLVWVAADYLMVR